MIKNQKNERAHEFKNRNDRNNRNVDIPINNAPNTSMFYSGNIFRYIYIL